MVADAGEQDDAVDRFIADFRSERGGADERKQKSHTPDPRHAAAPKKPAAGRIKATPTAKRLAEKLGVDLADVTASAADGRISTDDVQAAAARTGVRDAGADRRATPTARRLAAKLGVDLGSVRGTGAGGKITTADVENARPAETSDGHDVVKLTSMRKTIARRLTESKQNVPHFYLTVRIAMDALVARRAELKAGGSDISVNDCLVKALALALQDVPEANVQFHGDVLHRFHRSDIAIAVASDDGLITPVIRAADTLTVQDIAAQSRELAERGRAGKLTADEFSGGTTTLSNLGMYGIDQFDAVINPPQASIIAVGRAEPSVIAEDGRAVVRAMMSATMSCDHRAIDGALGAKLLAALRARVEAPHDWTG